MTPPVLLGAAIYADWERFVAGSRRPDATKDEMVRAFDAGRAERVDLWARRAADLSPLSTEVRRQVLDRRAELGLPADLNRDAA